MKTLHAVEGFGGGLLGIVRSIVTAQAEQGHEVTVAVGRRPETPHDVQAVFPNNVRVEVVWNERTARAQLRAARHLRRLAAATRPDVVHLHSSFAGLVGGAAIAGDRPTIYTPHGYAFQRSSDARASRAAYRAAEWWIARRCGLVAAVSEPEARLARCAVRAPEVVVIRNGIEELDEPALLTPAPVRDLGVVAYGRVEAARRPHETVRILEGVLDLAPVSWIGAAPHDEHEILKAAGISLTGWLPRAKALDRLRRATVSLHWSAWDGAALGILEALAHDVVVIASNIPANRAILGDRQVCDTVDEAVALIRRVLEDEDLRDDLLRDQRRIRSAFGGRLMTDAWLRLYEARAAGSSSRYTASMAATHSVTS